MKRYVPYQAYLLRLWPTQHDGRADYRAYLESVATGERKNFPNLQSLLAFLQTQREEGGKQKPLRDDSEGQHNEPQGS